MIGLRELTQGLRELNLGLRELTIYEGANSSSNPNTL